MVNMPEHLLIATAEKRAKALGISIKQAIAELKGESKPTIIQKIPKIIDVVPIENATPVAEEVVETPVAQEVVETPVAEEVVETPVAEEVVETIVEPKKITTVTQPEEEKSFKPKVPGFLIGMKIVVVNMFKTLLPFFENPNVNYPFEKEILAPRTRGVIALDEEACTSCMLCARSCPDWCIYIEGHKELQPPSKPGGRQRSRAVLDRFDIDYALCMYCGICVEVCPFDALFWSPEYEYSEFAMGDMLHDKERLDEWLKTVPQSPSLES